MREFAGKRVVVMGLGRFGGGIGVTRWLARQGADVLVTDLASEAELGASVAALQGEPVRFRLGGHDESDLDGCELLVVSPAVNKARAEFFQAARRRGIAWTSEMNLFLERCPGLIVGITGSVGKSTTTAMVGAILSAASDSGSWKHGRAWLGGNIGKSLLDDLEAMGPGDVVVLELSSFQLDDAGVIGFRPRIALMTNLRENHLDRHGTMEEYASAKANIFRFQRDGDILAVPMDGGLERLEAELEVRRPLWRFGVEEASGVIQIECREREATWTHRFGNVELRVPGLHNLQNAAAALTIALALEVDSDAARAALSRFEGLPHRLEFSGEVAGVRYYNDSKATTPEAAMTSIRAFAEPVIVLVGGSDKGSDFGALGRLIAERVKGAVCLGQTSKKIERAIIDARGDQQRPMVRTAEGFAEAVHAARGLAATGDVVLLAPACASYDMFRNYEERGECFRQLVGLKR